MGRKRGGRNEEITTEGGEGWRKEYEERQGQKTS